MSVQSAATQATNPQISQLFVYPIKSCAGISVSHFQFDQRGPLHDRRWMLVDAKTGIFLSQREFPKMALISTHIEKNRVWAGIGDESKLLELPVEGREVDVTIWEDDVQGIDCGDEAASWFNSVLGSECRLIYQGHCSRLASTKYAEAGTDISYADGFPLLVVAEESIQFLSSECSADIASENFRPNIVVANTAAFAEVHWQGLVTDSIVMKVVKPCERCVIPTLNPKTGIGEKGILQVLIKYCRRDKKIYFGQNLTFKAQNNASKNSCLTMAVGQKVTFTVTE